MIFNAYRLPLKARRAASQAPPRLLKIKAHRRRLVAKGRWVKTPACEGTGPTGVSPQQTGGDLAPFLGLVAVRPLRLGDRTIGQCSVAPLVLFKRSHPNVNAMETAWDHGGFALGSEPPTTGSTGWASSPDAT